MFSLFTSAPQVKEFFKLVAWLWPLINYELFPAYDCKWLLLQTFTWQLKVPLIIYLKERLTQHGMVFAITDFLTRKVSMCCFSVGFIYFTASANFSFHSNITVKCQQWISDHFGKGITLFLGLRGYRGPRRIGRLEFITFRVLSLNFKF